MAVASTLIPPAGSALSGHMPGMRAKNTRGKQKPYSVSQVNWLDATIRIVVVNRVKGVTRSMQGDFFVVTPNMSWQDIQDREEEIADALLDRAIKKLGGL